MLHNNFIFDTTLTKQETRLRYRSDFMYDTDPHGGWVFLMMFTIMLN